MGRSIALEQREQFGFNRELLVTGAATSFNTNLGKWESTMDFDWGNKHETLRYNNLQQLERLTVTGSSTTMLDLEYVFPAYVPATGLGNNGRLSKELNHASTTRTEYTYDYRNRLTAATNLNGVGSGGTTNWGRSFGYDVYGNRTSQAVTAGSGTGSTFTFDDNNRRRAGLRLEAGG